MLDAIVFLVAAGLSVLIVGTPVYIVFNFLQDWLRRDRIRMERPRAERDAAMHDPPALPAVKSPAPAAPQAAAIPIAPPAQQSAPAHPARRLNTDDAAKPKAASVTDEAPRTWSGRLASHAGASAVAYCDNQGRTLCGTCAERIDAESEEARAKLYGPDWRYTGIPSGADSGSTPLGEIRSFKVLGNNLARKDEPRSFRCDACGREVDSLGDFEQRLISWDDANRPLVESPASAWIRAEAGWLRHDRDERVFWVKSSAMSSGQDAPELTFEEEAAMARTHIGQPISSAMRRRLEILGLIIPPHKRRLEAMIHNVTPGELGYKLFASIPPEGIGREHPQYERVSRAIDTLQFISGEIATADGFCMRGDPEMALTWLTTYVDLYPSCAVLHSHMSEYYHESGCADQAHAEAIAHAQLLTDAGYIQQASMPWLSLWQLQKVRTTPVALGFIDTWYVLGQVTQVRAMIRACLETCQSSHGSDDAVAFFERLGHIWRIESRWFEAGNVHFDPSDPEYRELMNGQPIEGERLKLVDAVARRRVQEVAADQADLRQHAGTLRRWLDLSDASLAAGRKQEAARRLSVAKALASDDDERAAVQSRARALGLVK